MRVIRIGIGKFGITGRITRTAESSGRRPGKIMAVETVDAAAFFHMIMHFLMITWQSLGSVMTLATDFYLRPLMWPAQVFGNCQTMV